MGHKARMNILIGAGHLGQRAQQPNTAWHSPLNEERIYDLFELPLYAVGIESKDQIHF
jgi:hypothetical protein